MTKKGKMQILTGREERPTHTPGFSAGWGRALGLALLALSVVPSYAGDNQLKPKSVVWGKVPVPPPVSTLVSVLNLGTNEQGNQALAPKSVVWGKVPAPPPISVNVVNLGGLDASHKFAPEFQSSSDGSGRVTLRDAKDGDDMVTVIVQYRQMPTNTHLKSLQNGGAAIGSKLHAIRAVAMRVSTSMLSELAKNPNVAYITPDRAVSMTSNPQTEQFASAIQADIAASQYGLNGTGVGVAVIDSGIAPNSDLNNASGVSRVVYNQSFVPGDTSTSDKYGHGTHVAGLIGGSGAGSGTANGYAATYAGVAPNVNLINLRVLDVNGFGVDSQVIAAIQQAIALKNTYNIRVISMSLGRPIFESYTLDPVDQAVEAAWKAGIVVVVAAGNNGRFGATNGFGTIGVPANDPAVITVGATMTQLTSTRVDDQIASYSSKGPTSIDHIVKPDLVAPGNRMVSLRVAGSTLDTAYPQYQIAPTSGTAKYYELSGTSMATPIVSGAVVLMLQQNSALSPDQVKARLMKSAWKGLGQYTYSHDSRGNMYNNEYDLFTYGAGYLDVNAALGNTDLATGLAFSQTAVLSGNVVTVKNTTPDSAFAGSSVVWGATSVVWGNSVVWGSNALSATSVVWGSTSVVWGSTSVSGDSVVWGSYSSLVSSLAALSDGDPGDN
jgi:serine protease AprX